MSRVELSGNIGSLLSFYKHERRIFGRCPHCSVPFRLSEVKLTYGKEPPRDILSSMKSERDRLKDQLEELESKIEEVQSQHEYEIDSLDDRWRAKVDNEVEKRIQTRVKEIRRDAIDRSRVGQLGKTLEKLAPMIPGFGHHPYDVRPIFDPIDFVVFDGYFHGEITDIVFVEFKTGNSRLKAVQSSIKNAIIKKRVHFEERRMKKETIQLLTQRKPPKLKQLME